MILLVTGGSGSGKSEYAENQAAESGLPFRYYIATMEVWGQEEKNRILRHQNQRRGKGFSTIESPVDLDQIRIPSDPAKTAVLLECLTNLAANELFREEGDWKDPEEIMEKTEERILRGIGFLESRCALLVIVTGQVDQDGGDYDEGTRSYIRLLGRINRRIARRADRTVELVAGIPVNLSRKEKKEGGSLG